MRVIGTVRRGSASGLGKARATGSYQVARRGAARRATPGRSGAGSAPPPRSARPSRPRRPSTAQAHPCDQRDGATIDPIMLKAANATAHKQMENAGAGSDPAWSGRRPVACSCERNSPPEAKGKSAERRGRGSRGAERSCDSAPDPTVMSNGGLSRANPGVGAVGLHMGRPRGRSISSQRLLRAHIQRPRTSVLAAAPPQPPVWTAAGGEETGQGGRRVVRPACLARLGLKSLVGGTQNSTAKGRGAVPRPVSHGSGCRSRRWGTAPAPSSLFRPPRTETSVASRHLDECSGCYS